MKKSQTQKDKYNMTHLYKRLGIRKSIETKGRLEVVRGWEKGATGRFKVYGVSVL